MQRQQLLDHPLVQRLLNNPNWKPLALAAVSHFVDGKKCVVPSWVRSSCWKQVEVAYREIDEFSAAAKKKLVG